MSAADENRKVTGAYNKGLRDGREEMKIAILKNIKSDIKWVGDSRMAELSAYVNAIYSSMNLSNI
jgi:hypothetical protein